LKAEVLEVGKWREAEATAAGSEASEVKNVLDESPAAAFEGGRPIRRRSPFPRRAAAQNVDLAEAAPTGSCQTPNAEVEIGGYRPSKEGSAAIGRRQLDKDWGSEEGQRQCDCSDGLAIW
jgi:hypothetical protein